MYQSGYNTLGLPDDGNDSLKCNYYHDNDKVHIIYDGYEGIPENLLINVIVWLVLLILFAILRKKAWNYGRIALVQKNENRGLFRQHSRYNPWTQLFYGDVEGAAAMSRCDNTDRASIDSQEYATYVERCFCSWIPAIFKITDQQILRRNGPDAVQYLSFQRYIILYMVILTIISVGIILPVNFQGTLEGDSKVFGHTTISNLPPNSPYLWCHVIFSILLLPLGVYFMRHFSVNLKFEEQTTVSCTLMITDIPKDKCTKSALYQHFLDAYPECTIKEVQLAYNIKELITLNDKRVAAGDAKAWSENFLKDYGKRLQIRPYRCSWVLRCCDRCGCRKVDAIDFYSGKEDLLMSEVEKERVLAMEKALGICFITFQSEDMAFKIYKDHQHSCRCGKNPPTSKVSAELEPYRWGVENAPPPDDIQWKNLSSNSENWYLKAGCINFCLFFVLFFLTTPFVIINTINLFNFTAHIENITPLLSQFLPTLMLWTISALLPVLVSFSDQFVNHWTRSAENHSVMRKTFIFLLFMIVILPSLGLTSAKALVEWTVQSANNTSIRWECIYLPDNGAFFVNYVITSAFIGTALELIRFPELFMYIMRLCCIRSKAEQGSVRKAIVWEFPFGVDYAWMLLIFAVTVMYSLTTPLIVPFGLIYMCLKHCVDRYNIFFAYGPSKISKKIHGTAINFVVASILLLQLLLLSFTILRLGLHTITIVSLAFFVITASIYIMQLFFNLFRGISPILYTSFRHKLEDGAGDVEEPTSPNFQVKFLPNVLSQDVPRTESGFYSSATKSVQGKSLNYGSADEGGNEEGSAVRRIKSKDGLYQNYSGSHPGSVNGSVEPPEESTA